MLHLRNKKTRLVRSSANKAHKKHRRNKTQHFARKFIICVFLLGLSLVLALLVGDADYKATAIAWIPFLMLVFTLLVSFIYVKILGHGLRIEAQGELHDCRRGDKAHFSIHFTNKTPLYFFYLNIYFYVSDLFGGVASETQTSLSLSPFEKYDLDFTTTFEHIGTYKAGMERVIIYDFLHLFTFEIHKDYTRMVHVTPRIQNLENLELSTESRLEAKTPKKSVFADSLDYAYVRPYVPGDPLKTIHWKISARSDDYMTRLFEENTNPGVAVVLDFYAPEVRIAQLMGMFDALVETAFSIGTYAKTEGLDVDIFYTNKSGEHVKRSTWKSNELEEIVQDMPSITNDETKAEDGLNVFSEQLRNQYGQNNLVMCTANLSSQLISAVIDAKIQQRNPILFAIIPTDLIGKELEDYTANLRRLDEANIGYKILRSSDDLVQEVA